MGPMRSMAVQDHIALAEIELCGELMIAASSADGERLSPDRIDEVLKVAGPMGVGAVGAGAAVQDPWMQDSWLLERWVRE